MSERVTTTHYRYQLCEDRLGETLDWFTSWASAASAAEGWARAEHDLRLVICDRMARRHQPVKWERRGEREWSVVERRGDVTVPTPLSGD